jgi:hypothetical protein
MKKDSLSFLFSRARKPGFDREITERDVCEKILVSKISGSDVLRSKVVFKGGVFLSFLTGGERGYTKDIDLDLVHHRMDEKSLVSFFLSLNDSAIYPFVRISFVPGSYQKIRLANYHGARVTLLFSDGSISYCLLADIGLFDKLYNVDGLREFQVTWLNSSFRIQAETNDLIIAEKLSTFAIYGSANERIKDMYDAFWLIRNTVFSQKRVRSYLEVILVKQRAIFSDIKMGLTALVAVFSDQAYLKRFSSQTNWTQVDIFSIGQYLCSFVRGLDSLKKD